MSRSRRRRKPRYFAAYEDTYHRRASVRQWKAKVRQADRIGAHDDAPVFRGTQGWLTW